MATAKQKVATPVPVVAPQEDYTGPSIEFVGDGAQDVQFTVDVNAKSMTVYSTGVVITNY